MGAEIGTGEYPCQPYNGCSPFSGVPCGNGVFNGGEISVDDLNTSGWDGGTGWNGNWTAAGSATKSTNNGPQGTRHVQMSGGGASPDGTITRIFSTAGAVGADVEYAIKRNSDFSGSDRLFVEVSTNGTSWTTLASYSNDGSGSSDPVGTSYSTVSEALPASFADQPTVYLRFRGEMGNSSDRIWIDSVGITVGSSNGFVDGNDGSHPQTCNEDPTPRERQLDVRTLRLARAMKQQDVEIFVVAFAADIPGCNLNSTAEYDYTDPDDCNTILDADAGPIGDATHDGTANHRLLKCISSNTPGSNDHYFFADEAEDLDAIFTAIANQIAHRLIE
jgi:hypothetical protein